jgi:hypothetical protein
MGQRGMEPHYSRFKAGVEFALGRRLNKFLRLHANNASMWAVHVPYEKERDGHHKRQNQYQDAFGFNSSCTIADQQVEQMAIAAIIPQAAKGGFGSTRQPACIPASSTHHSCQKLPGRPLVSAAMQPGAWTADHSIRRCRPNPEGQGERSRCGNGENDERLLGRFREDR